MPQSAVNGSQKEEKDKKFKAEKKNPNQPNQKPANHQSERKQNKPTKCLWEDKWMNRIFYIFGIFSICE